jgi:alkanesulfonate monooxygenase SsuD/methylene tetrahydromethanopterin reductase-like flavin-dependent oxidoreductase (luciferase family)
MEQIDVNCPIMQYREASPQGETERPRDRSDAPSIRRGRHVRFGIFILGDKPPQSSHQEVLANVLEEARWAEELGFDEVWLAEHHFSAYGTLANLPLIASAIAAQTERIRIGTACMVAPFHDPIHLAEQIAMADALSGGRFDAGFGRGYQSHEFAGFGISMDEASARYKECVTIVEGLLGNERFSYDGEFWHVDDLTVHPRPVQEPVPIWCTVMKTPSSFEWLAETGYGAIIGNPYQVDVDLATGLDLYLKSRADRGLERATDQVWALLNAFLDPDDAVARSYPRESVEMSIAVHRQYSNPFERGGEIPADYKAYADWFDNHDAQTYEQILDAPLTLMGSPDRVIEKMGTIVDMGWQNLMLRMSRGGAMDRSRVRASMELFAREVMPAVAELESAKV